MFFEPSRTQFDLNFSLFGIHVRVHPAFWIVALVFGSSALNDGLVFLLVWVACLFVSILIHEMGHVLAGMCFGSRGNIVLYSFGGLAVGSSELESRWQRVVVFLAGPGA